MILSSFCKVLDTYPAPVVPIFSGENGADEYFQLIDEDKKISGFESITILDRTRVITDTSSAITKREIGNAALYGLAIDGNHVVVGTYNTIKTNISKQISDVRVSENPFAILDVAMFLQDDDLIFSAAEACQTKLSNISPALSQKWLVGSPLSLELKDRLRAVTAQPPETASLPEIHRFGFTGPWVAMGAITAYCSHHFGFRSDLIRSYFENDEKYDEIISASDRLTECLEILLQLQKRNLRIRNFNALSPSRGSVYLWLRNSQGFFDLRNSFRENLRRNALYRDYRGTSMYSSGTEHLSFLMVMCILLRSEGFSAGVRQVEVGDRSVQYKFATASTLQFL